MSNNRYDKDRELFNSLFKNNTLDQAILDYNHTNKELKELKKTFASYSNRVKYLKTIDENRILLYNYIDKIELSNEDEKKQIDSVQQYLISRIDSEVSFYEEKLNDVNEKLNILSEKHQKLLTKLESVKKDIEIHADNENSIKSDDISPK